MRILSIDPGLCAGWAYIDSSPKGCVLTSAGIHMPPMFAPDIVIVEVPTVYPKDQVDPQNIIKLSLSAGRAVSRYLDHTAEPVPTFGVYPRKWKGSVKKDAHQAQFLSKLDKVNATTLNQAVFGFPASKINNAIDAVALGFWFHTVLEAGRKLSRDPFKYAASMCDYVFPSL